MKLHRSLCLFAAAALFSAAAYSQGGKSAGGSSADSDKAFLGRWDMTLKAPDHEYPSWLELRKENGTLKAEYTGRWGNPRPLPSAELSNGKVKFTSPKEEEGSKTDLVFEGTLTGNLMAKPGNGPDAERRPSKERARRVGEKRSLFSTKRI
ncbi:MAG: hypothetical protein ABSH39_16215 [Candidatus Acidiferrum sp.]